jgi:recombinational DNA repair ATPase RecF
LDRVLASYDLDLREVSLEYRPSIEVNDDRAENVLTMLEEASRNERREARPLIGPQRDEVEIRWGGHQARRVLSAGERKLLGLLLTAARARVLEEAGRPPILLLDDADSELDEERLTSVWGCFQGVNQTFVSSSRRSPWKVDFRVTRWDLNAGRLRPENSLQEFT